MQRETSRASDEDVSVNHLSLSLSLLTPQGHQLSPPKPDPLIAQFTPMVKKMARSYYRSRIALSLDLEDLEQEGFQALFVALSKFDGERGMAFSSFAWHRVNEAMLRTKAHCSRGMRSMATMSLSAAGDDDGVWDFASTVRSPEELADVSICTAEVRRLVSALEPRQQEVLRLRYWDGETLEGIGTELGLSRERVRNIQDETVSRLRRSMQRDHMIARAHKSTSSQQSVIDESGGEVHLRDAKFVAPIPTTEKGARRNG